MHMWKDWHEQGGRDFERANLDFDYAYYEWACFTSEKQAKEALDAADNIIRFCEGFLFWQE